MSFYGNVTYYLSNAFNKMVFRNANSASTKPNGDSVADGTAAPYSVAYEYSLQPRSRADDMILETGNKWIVFGDPEHTVNQNQIRIFHQLAPDPIDAGGVIQTTIAAPSGTVEKDGNLNFSDLITIPTIGFDKAGHISSVTTRTYQLAEPPGANDLDAVMLRLAILEEIVTGEHGDPNTGGDSGGGSGGGSGSGSGGESDVPNVENNVTSEVQKIKVKISEWEMKTGTQDGYENFREEYGIGTTLHELMALIGTRQKVQYEDQITHEQVYGYAPQSTNAAMLDSTTLYGKAAQSYSLSTAAIDYAVRNREGILSMLTYLTNTNSISETDANYLRNTFFTTSPQSQP